MGLSEDLRKVGETITTGEAKSLMLDGLDYSFIHDGEKVTYEIKIGKFGPYVLSSIQDEGGKALMRSIPPTLFPGTFNDGDAENLLFPPEEEGVVLYGRFNLKKGRYGDYFERLDDGSTVTWPKALKRNAKDASEEMIDLLFSLPKTIGFDSDMTPVVLKAGPYGFYAQYNGKNVKVADPLNITVEDIIEPTGKGGLKGEYMGKPISLMSGRYGLYIKWGDENIPLPISMKKYPEDLSLEKISEIASAHASREEKSVEGEKEFAPVDGTKVVLVNGKFGYYLKWGRENVAIPKEDKENPSLLTDERVAALIEEYKAKPKTTKKFTRKKK